MNSKMPVYPTTGTRVPVSSCNVKPNLCGRLNYVNDNRDAYDWE